MDKQELDAKIEEIAKALLSYCSARTSNYFEADYIENKSCSEISDCLSISESMVKYLLFNSATSGKLSVNSHSYLLSEFVVICWMKIILRYICSVAN